MIAQLLSKLDPQNGQATTAIPVDPARLLVGSRFGGPRGDVFSSSNCS